eukprot:g5376.t1
MDALFQDFEEKLAAEDTIFTDLDVDTPWKDLLKDLGFSALQVGKLLKEIKRKLEERRDPSLSSKPLSSPSSLSSSSLSPSPSSESSSSSSLSSSSAASTLQQTPPEQQQQQQHEQEQEQEEQEQEQEQEQEPEQKQEQEQPTAENTEKGREVPPADDEVERAFLALSTEPPLDTPLHSLSQQRVDQLQQRQQDEELAKEQQRHQGQAQLTEYLRKRKEKLQARKQNRAQQQQPAESMPAPADRLENNIDSADRRDGEKNDKRRGPPGNPVALLPDAVREKKTAAELAQLQFLYMTMLSKPDQSVAKLSDRAGHVRLERSLQGVTTPDTAKAGPHVSELNNGEASYGGDNGVGLNKCQKTGPRTS